MSKACNNPDCYNYDTNGKVFCSDCIKQVVDKMTCDDLYDMYAEGHFNFDRAIEDGEAHGVLTPRGKKAIMKCRRQWFKLINNIMLNKINTGN